jgi:hypothetical protein
VSARSRRWYAALIEMEEGTAIISESSAGSKSLPTTPTAEQTKGHATESAAALVVVGVSSATFANSLSVTSWRASVAAAARRSRAGVSRAHRPETIRRLAIRAGIRRVGAQVELDGC